MDIWTCPTITEDSKACTQFTWCLKADVRKLTIERTLTSVNYMILIMEIRIFLFTITIKVMLWKIEVVMSLEWLIKVEHGWGKLGTESCSKDIIWKPKCHQNISRDLLLKEEQILSCGCQVTVSNRSTARRFPWPNAVIKQNVRGKSIS